MNKVSALEMHVAGLLDQMPEVELEAAGVILTGHFTLRNGHHSYKYIKFTREFLDSEAGQNTLVAFVDRLKKFKRIDLNAVEVVAGPQTGGALLADAVTNLLNARHNSIKVVSVTVDKHSGQELDYSLSRDAHNIVSGRKVLVVDDVWNTGLTLAAQVLPILRHAGAKVLGVAVLANRGNASMPPLCHLFEYWKVSKYDCFAIQDCPMCKAGEPRTEF